MHLILTASISFTVDLQCMQFLWQLEYQVIPEITGFLKVY